MSHSLATPRLAITTTLDTERGAVRIDFSVPCKWVRLSPFEARSLAKSLIDKADALDPSRTADAAADDPSCARLRLV
jgi:hypothetical protein